MCAYRWDTTLVGLRWDEAERLLQRAAVPYRTRLTGPAGDGELRVVQERSLPGERLVVLVYRTGGRAPAGST